MRNIIIVTGTALCLSAGTAFAEVAAAAKAVENSAFLSRGADQAERARDGHSGLRAHVGCRNAHEQARLVADMPIAVPEQASAARAEIVSISSVGGPSGAPADAEVQMSAQRNAKRRPGFGKRGSVKVKQTERKPSGSGRLTRMFGRWWGAKEPQKMAKKGFGFRRTRADTAEPGGRQAPGSPSSGDASRRRDSGISGGLLGNHGGRGRAGRGLGEGLALNRAPSLDDLQRGR